MLNNRVIPILLLSEGGLYKTERFSSPKYVGDPINVIKIFNEKEVDELVVLDISASKKRRAPDFRLIEQFAGECFMPLCYGGGVRSVEDAKRLFSLGVEKISVQAAALEDLGVVSRIAERFGSQSVVVSVDIKKGWLGRCALYSSATGKQAGRSWQEFLRAVEAAGAGEVLLQSVDREGTMKGMDFELIREASSCLTIPMIASGGVGSLGDIRKAVDAGAYAVGVGAFFVFQGPHRAVLISYPRYQELKGLFK